jgi:hypothetical protein
MTRAATIRALAAQLDRLSTASFGPAEPAPPLTTGWSAIDAALAGGLRRDALHEWFGPTPPATDTSSPAATEKSRPKTAPAARAQRTRWRPPTCVLVHLAHRALDTDSQPGWVVWVGRRCFPYPHVLVRGLIAENLTTDAPAAPNAPAAPDSRLLERSLFVAVRTADHRLLTADLALRSPAISTVIADGSGFSMPATRRLQLLAQRHQTPALLVRPPQEQAELSAAHSRWLLRWEPAVDPPPRAQPRWQVELLRCKGVPLERLQGPWLLEWNGDTGALNLPATLGHPARSTQAPPGPPAHRARPA